MAKRGRSTRSKPALTARQARFVAEYLRDLNATQAAIRAGYSAHTATEQGTRLLTNVQVAAAVEAGKATLAARTEASIEGVVRELRAIAEIDPGEVWDFTGNILRLRAPTEIPERARRAIRSVKIKQVVEGAGEHARIVEYVEITLHDKIAALRELGLHLPGFRAPTKQEHGGKDGGPITLRVVYEDAPPPTP